MRKRVFSKKWFEKIICRHFTQSMSEIVHAVCTSHDEFHFTTEKYQNIFVESTLLPRKFKNVIRKADSNNKMTEKGAQGFNRSRRGHQNHPKNVGIRTSKVPASEIIQALRDGRNLDSLYHQSTTVDNKNISRLTETCDENISCNVELKSKRNSSSSSLNSTPSEKSEKKSSRSHDGKKKRVRSDIGRITRAAADGAEDVTDEDDAETVELSKLRCTSERTELVAEREHRRQKKCADYPGLAFGRSIFSSDSMMKFNIIRNELQNIMNNQLRRVSLTRQRVQWVN